MARSKPFLVSIQAKPTAKPVSLILHMSLQAMYSAYPNSFFSDWQYVRISLHTSALLSGSF